MISKMKPWGDLPMYSYLEKLSLSFDEKEKIARLGISNAAALLAMIQAAPENFRNYLGGEHFFSLIQELKNLISNSEQVILNQPTKQFCANGAIIERAAPQLKPPKYNVAERDRLFEQLQYLRQKNDALPTTRKRIAAIEQKLNTMLNEV